MYQSGTGHYETLYLIDHVAAQASAIGNDMLGIMALQRIGRPIVSCVPKGAISSR